MTAMAVCVWMHVTTAPGVESKNTYFGIKYASSLRHRAGKFNR